MIGRCLATGENPTCILPKFRIPGSGRRAACSEIPVGQFIQQKNQVTSVRLRSDIFHHGEPRPEELTLLIGHASPGCLDGRSLISQTRLDRGSQIKSKHVPPIATVFAQIIISREWLLVSIRSSGILAVEQWFIERERKMPESMVTHFMRSGEKMIRNHLPIIFCQRAPISNPVESSPKTETIEYGNNGRKIRTAEIIKTNGYESLVIRQHRVVSPFQGKVEILSQGRRGARHLFPNSIPVRKIQTSPDSTLNRYAFGMGIQSSLYLTLERKGKTFFEFYGETYQIIPLTNPKSISGRSIQANASLGRSHIKNKRMTRIIHGHRDVSRQVFISVAPQFNLADARRLYLEPDAPANMKKGQIKAIGTCKCKESLFIKSPGSSYLIRR